MGGGGGEPSVNRGNRPGEGEVTAQTRGDLGWGKSSLCSFIHACIHSHVHLLAAISEVPAMRCAEL